MFRGPGFGEIKAKTEMAKYSAEQAAYHLVMTTPLDGKVALVAGATRGAARGIAVELGATDVDGSQPDAWRYTVEVQDAGKPADATGYR